MGQLRLSFGLSVGNEERSHHIYSQARRRIAATRVSRLALRSNFRSILRQAEWDTNIPFLSLEIRFIRALCASYLFYFSFYDFYNQGYLGHRQFKCYPLVN